MAVQKSALIVGSSRHLSDPAQIEEFRDACRALGRSLADQFTIVAGSGAEETADVYVIGGALDANPDVLIRVIRPGGIDEGLGLIDPERVAVEIDQRASNWEGVRGTQVAAADVVVIIGGGKGSMNTHFAARELGRPVVAVPAFGGAAAKLYQEYRDAYRKAGQSEKELKRIEQWNDESASAVLRAIELLLWASPESPPEEPKTVSLQQVLTAAARLGRGDRQAIEQAAALARAHERDLGATLLLFAALLLRADQESPSDSAAVLTQWVLQRPNDSSAADNDTNAAILEGLGLGGLKLDVEVSPQDLETTDGTKIAQILNTADAYRERTRPDGDIKTRHLLFASLATSLSPPLIIYLIQRGASPEDLRRRFLTFVAEQHPRDVAEAWERILNEILDSTNPSPSDEGISEVAVASALGDEPAKVDRLGRGPLVESLASICGSERQGTPFTVALLGDWGAGKTSVFEQLENKLKEKHPGRFLFARFNAWEYEHTDNLAAGLAQEVVRALTWPANTLWGEIAATCQKLPLRLCFAVNEYRWTFLWALLKLGAPWTGGGLLLYIIATELIHNSQQASVENWQEQLLFWLNVTLGSTAAVALFVFGSYFGRDVLRLVQHPVSTQLMTYMQLPNYGSHLGLIPVLKRHLRYLCEFRLLRWGERRRRRREQASDTPSDEKPYLRRLLVLVDDLDRCSSDCILQTFDAIRLVMDIPGVIVIIGVDHRIAFSAVAGRYAHLASAHRSPADIARDYLGKIIQLPIQLSDPTRGGLIRFTAEHLMAVNAEELRQLIEDDQNLSVTSPAANTQATRSRQTSPPPAGQPVTSQSASESKAPSGQGSSRVKGATDETPARDEPPAMLDSLDEVAAHLVVARDRVDEWLAAGCVALKEAPYKLADIVAWRDEREMEHTVVEAARFVRLAEGFGFRNPRRLLRLRNTYRLAKLLQSKRERHGMAPLVTREQLMDMMFWHEFLYGLNTESRRICQKVIAGQQAAAEIEDVAIRDTVKIAGQLIDWDQRNAEGYTHASDLVSRLILPRGDEVVAMVDGSQNQ